MSKKVIISIISITLVSLMILPALGKASNCGGNSAALSLCSSYTTSLIAELVDLEEFPNNLGLDDLSKEFKQNIWASSHWTGDAKYLLRKKGINLNSGKKQIIIVCDTPYNNVPESQWSKIPYTHAVCYSDGSKDLITKEQYKFLDLTNFVDAKVFKETESTAGEE